MTKRLGLWLFAIALGIVAVVVVVLVINRVPQSVQRSDSQHPGDDVFPMKVNGISYTYSFDIGVTFTNGTITAEVAKGPLVIKEVEVVSEGDTVEVLGVTIRRLSNFTVPPVDIIAGWPSAHPGTSTVKPSGFKVPAPPVSDTPGGRVFLELQIGYKVVGEGRSVRRGLYLTYEYQLSTRRVFIPSYAAWCSPMTVACDPELPEGRDTNNPMPGKPLPIPRRS
jgi:hypothetical protein